LTIALGCAAGTTTALPEGHTGDPAQARDGGEDGENQPDDSDGSPEGEHDAGKSAGDASVSSLDAALRPADGGPQPDGASERDDGGALPAGCTRVNTDTLLSVARTSEAGEYALALEASSLADTRWGQAGNEALILDVLANGSVLGQLILHQGKTPFVYMMHLGALASSAAVSVRVSALSAAQAGSEACVGAATLHTAAEFGDAEALANAPVFLWPLEKRFDDVPLLLGYSRTLKRYEVVYSNENGGTTASCGGGGGGVQALIARWGRAADVEAAYDLSGDKPRWLRCTGNTDTSAHALRYEAKHPLLYYGDGHNRLFESRGGYGQSCGTGSAEKADGNLTGWNANNPGSDAGHDDPFVLRLRPLPVSLDDIPEYLSSPEGRREGLVDHYAPWLYRLTFEELAREGKIDNSRSFAMERYVFMDVRASDVGGQGDSYCSTGGLKSGFKVRLIGKNGQVLAGPQITADYFPGPVGWKRIGFPLDRTYAPGEITTLEFDAYDNDGVYFLALGDLFTLTPSETNGASLRFWHRGSEPVNVYVDDNNGGCSNGLNHDGPSDGPAAGYPCAGSAYDLPL
jgi:hypothetical protein